jgi:uncharacterized CHY-type Zn-finger protein
MLSTHLVKCGKCKFTFHNNTQIDTCPRCNAKLNPNLQQGSSNDKNITAINNKKLRDLQKILYKFTGLKE